MERLAGSGGRQARDRPHRDQAPELHSAGRISLRRRTHLSRRPAHAIRQRELSRGTCGRRWKIGYECFSSRARHRLGLKEVHRSWGSAATSRVRASDPTRAPMCAWMAPPGGLVVATCVGTQGQSHRDRFAQIVADELGIRPDEVDITTGDSRSMNWGSGTYASRSAVVTGNAIGAAAHSVAEGTRIASELFEASPDDIEACGWAGVGVKGRRITAFPSGTWPWSPTRSGMRTATRPTKRWGCRPKDGPALDRAGSRA